MTRLFALLAAALAAAPLPVAAMSVTSRIPLADGGWDYVSVDPASNRLFVARGDGVATIDLATRVVTPQLVAATRTHAALVIPGTTIGIVTSTADGGVMLFDATTGKVTVDIKTGPKPDAATYDLATKSLLVMDNKDGSVTIVDPATGKKTGTIAIGGALEFAVTDNRGRLYVNVEDKNTLVTVDIKSRTIVRTTPLTGCDEPSGLALTRNGVLISACSNGVAKTIDAKTGKPMADIAIGPHPDAVLYDATRDRAYVPSGGDGTLTVIDTHGHAARKIASVATQKGARTGAVDPATGTVYLPAARYEDPVGDARPKVVPGSVEMLVVN